MSIASRINEIREHLTNTWDDIDSLGIGVKILPNEYTQVDYLESSGTQYIDTGVNADNKLSIKLEFGNLSLSKFIYQGAMAGDNSSNRVRHHMQLANDNSVVYWAGVLDSGCSTRIISGEDYDSSKKYNLFADIYNQKYYLDNIEISGFFNSNDFDTEVDYYLFGRNTNNVADSMGQIRIYSCKMYYENVLVRDFIPCYRNSDNEVGLYDLLNNVFYTNQGTGVFTYGSENIEYIDKNLENVDVTLKKLYGTISDKTDMSTNGIKGDTNQETITAETGTNVNAKSISISDVDTDKEHYFKIDGDTNQETIQEEVGTSVSDTSIYVDDVNTSKENTIELSGNIHQDSTTGKNLANFINTMPYSYASGIPTTVSTLTTITNKTTNAYTITYGTNSFIGALSNEMTFEENTDYVFSFKRPQNSNFAQRMHILQVNNDDSYTLLQAINVNVYGTPYQYTYSNTTEKKVAFMISVSSSTPKNETETISEIMVRKSTTSDTYEPYTYGASPNPDYPQNIEVVTGNQNVEVCGKNLFDKNKVTEDKYINAFNEIVGAPDWVITDYIPVVENETYTYNGLTTVGNAPYSIYYDRNKNFVSSFKQAIGTNTITIPSGVNYVRFSIRNNTENHNTDTFMIEKGSTSSTYEEYQGTTYPINLGKNLFDKNSAMVLDNYYIGGNGNFIAGEGYHSIYLPCESNTTYTISWGSINPTSQNRCRIATCDSTITTSSTLTILFNGANTQYHSPQTITTPSDAKYIVLDLIASSATTTVSQLMSSIQIEKGSTATDYAPYFNPIELCKIGTYQDKIYKQNDKWYLEKNIDTVTLNGSETDWEYYTATNKPVFYLGVSTIFNYLQQENLVCYSNYYQGKGQANSFNDVYNLGNNVIAFRTTYKRLVIRNDNISSVSDFQMWLSTHNTSVYYVLATPTTTEITDSTLVSQLNALYNAQLYPITNINTDTNNLLPYIDLTYNKVTPSPSPSRSSNVNVATGENTIKIEGKNKLDTSNIVTGTKNGITTSYDNVTQEITFNGTCTANNTQIVVSTDTIPFTNATTKIVAHYVSGSLTTNSLFRTFSKNYGNYEGIFINQLTSSNPIITKSTTMQVDKERFDFRFDTGAVADNFKIKLMITDSNDTTYEEYQGTTYPINLGNIELCKIDTYQDRIYKQNDKWYLYKETGKVILDGSENWELSTVTGNVNTQRFRVYYSIPHIADVGFCKEFIVKDANTSMYSDKELFQFSSGSNNTFTGIQININRLSSNTVEAFKTWLSNNNVTAYYALLNPTTTEITDSTLVNQLNALANSTLYATTNINTETSNLLPYIDLQYNVVTPAPSPERSSEVQNVSGDISYKITGKNKLNPADFNTTEAVNGISALANQYYLQLSGTPTGTNRAIGTNLDITNIVKNLNTVTFSFSAISGEYPYSFRLYVRDTTSTIVERIDTATKTVTYTDGYTYTIAPFILSTATASEINCTLALQLEQGDTATTFEPYLEKTYPVSLGDIELCKISTYQDRIYSDNGKIYLEKNNDKVVLNGSEIISLRSNTSTTHTKFILKNALPLESMTSTSLISDKFIANIGANSQPYSGDAICSNGTSGYKRYVYISISNDKASTVSEMTSWLSTHNTTLYYALANPTTTEITPTNYPTLYNQLKDIIDYLTQYKINNEFILGYDSPEIEY